MEMYNSKLRTIMKNVVFLTIILICNISLAQVSIGNENARGASILDLGGGTLNGIVLPYNNTTINPINGMLRVDANTSKIQLFTENDWVDLTEQGEMPVDYNNNEEIAINSGVTISDNEINNPDLIGVLVLESKSKALTLPQIINPHINVVDPPIGMICYDPQNKVIAMYNGQNWYFYK